MIASPFHLTSARSGRTPSSQTSWMRVGFETQVHDQYATVQTTDASERCQSFFSHVTHVAYVNRCLSLLPIPNIHVFFFVSFVPLMNPGPSMNGTAVSVPTQYKIYDFFF
jgi:hypothetical protein